ncbi:hypothetical protein [Streptomyces formicae]|uniref:Uncharacterized protein n=1 Tax=Streptomyces formicae TaxID=1616117 RepID=A0A291QN44_9ACTN|nr:hypothetical protein [Streptomyces formicae]ATL32855.1 hypothetical protein KY5_7837c [Streptomyces formicae]
MRVIPAGRLAVRPAPRRRPRPRLPVVGVAAAFAVLVGAGAATLGTTAVEEERTPVSVQARP